MPGKPTFRRLTPTSPPPQPGPAPQSRAAEAAGDAPVTNANGDGALLTPAQAAALLSVTERVLERWRSTGDGPPFAKLSRRTVRYRTADVRAFVAVNVRANTTA